jgi:hypothetical protein
VAKNAGVDVLTAATVKGTVFRCLMQCSLVEYAEVSEKLTASVFRAEE